MILFFFSLLLSLLSLVVLSASRPSLTRYVFFYSLSLLSWLALAVLLVFSANAPLVESFVLWSVSLLFRVELLLNLCPHSVLSKTLHSCTLSIISCSLTRSYFACASFCIRTSSVSSSNFSHSIISLTRSFSARSSSVSYSLNLYFHFSLRFRLLVAQSARSQRQFVCILFFGNFYNCLLSPLIKIRCVRCLTAFDVAVTLLLLLRVTLLHRNSLKALQLQLNEHKQSVIKNRLKIIGLVKR